MPDDRTTRVQQSFSSSMCSRFPQLPTSKKKGTTTGRSKDATRGSRIKKVLQNEDARDNRLCRFASAH